MTKKQLRPPKWTRTQLEALLRSRYRDDVNAGSFSLEDEYDTNPFVVLHRARKRYIGEGAQTALRLD